ncbi:glycoside hydrolase family 88 protein [Pseudoduganella namucuonensis]|uniref:Rhamnogalacturonyl hydrolase YesR n=1 Tax=Pseudoduganella namucuonensis TaxID=1035707 RepID=A0A1I7LPR2_9BURK|nr:glycoside hydrolase family 88 protein [Pseudoduganella namucuonensis]SFV11665.1 Rhamnogalacturonyl hydrolase YesR [Pseudoduganella namucuonensis]
MRTATVIGLTTDRRPIRAYADGGHSDYRTDKTRVLLLGPEGWDAAPLLAWFDTAAGLRERIALSAVADPAPLASYPPQGEAYAAAPEAHCLWRWIGLQAPDLVVAVRTGARDDGLAARLPHAAAAGVGAIPVVAVAALNAETLAPLLAEWRGGHSPARAEMWRRLAREPHEIARLLSAKYATALEQPVYIPAMALLCRLRLGDTAAVEAIVAPYVDGRKSALANLTSSHFAGHLLFGALARATGKRAYLDLARAAADLAFDNGEPLEAMPLHDEMSDSLFLVCPLLAQVGALTGERRYADMCVRHMRHMRRLTLRADALHRHSPLSDTAWGRGNGFAALGLLFSLEYLPRGHEAWPAVLKDFQAHMAALLAHQDASGMWRQVIDLPGSFPELSATCMIAAALARGVRRGWLPSGAHGDALARAWYGIRMRVSAEGELVDVCAGTGKQTSLQAYIGRPALLGADPRGGAMALLAATELMGVEKEGEKGVRFGIF